MYRRTALISRRCQAQVHTHANHNKEQVCLALPWHLANAPFNITSTRRQRQKNGGAGAHLPWRSEARLGGSERQAGTILIKRILIKKTFLDLRVVSWLFIDLISYHPPPPPPTRSHRATKTPWFSGVDSGRQPQLKMVWVKQRLALTSFPSIKPIHPLPQKNILARNIPPPLKKKRQSNSLQSTPTKNRGASDTKPIYRKKRWKKKYNKKKNAAEVWSAANKKIRRQQSTA